jgi:hypothetical protein
MPTAQSLIRSASFSPEVVAMLGNVFDEAWATVTPRPRDHQETLRLVLAEALIDLAAVGQTDPEKLKDLALLRLHKHMGV